MSDEILEVNGQSLANATHNEVIQYIHQVIISLYYVISIFGVVIFHDLSLYFMISRFLINYCHFFENKDNIINKKIFKKNREIENM